MATIHSLPLELFSRIFELAHDPHTPSTMCSASLVCRAWQGPAQRELFRSIVVPLCHANHHKPIEGLEETIKIWQRFHQNRLHAPHKAEVVEAVLPVGGVSAPSRRIPALTPGPKAQEMRYIQGVHSLKLVKIATLEGFLNDAGLQDMQSLILVRHKWGFDRKASDTGPWSWPLNLRTLTSSPLDLERILESYTPHTLLDSLHLVCTDYYLADQIASISRIGILPASLTNLSLTLPSATNIGTGLPARAAELDFAALGPFFHILHALTHLTIRITLLPLNHPLLQSLPDILPAAIKHLTIETPTRLPIGKLPFPDLLNLFYNNRLRNLARVDFPDCKRKELVEEPASADVLSECERRAIRVVCWEEFL